MKKILIILFCLIVAFNVFADRKSYDAVPSTNASYNNYLHDVVGNKNDRLTHNSIYGMAKKIAWCVTNEYTFVYPTLSNGITLSNGGLWTNGNYKTVIASNAITSSFDIQGISIESMSSNAIYEISLYAGSAYDAATNLIGQIRVGKTAVTENIGFYPIESPVLPAGQIIRAREAVNRTSKDILSVITIRYNIR